MDVQQQSLKTLRLLKERAAVLTIRMRVYGHRTPWLIPLIQFLTPRSTSGLLKYTPSLLNVNSLLGNSPSVPDPLPPLMTP